MKGTLVIIRGGVPGGSSEPAAMLSFDDTPTQAQYKHLHEAFEEWWNHRGGVFMIGGVDLSVVSIDLDVHDGSVTLLPAK